MIQSTSHLSGYYRADAVSNLPTQKASLPAAQTDASDHLSKASTDGLRQALAQTSEIRPHIVERGKVLAVDPNYPPRQLIESLSKLLIASRDPSETN